jgi:hypothetical protein
VRELLQLVVIDLTADENAQEIFETLNARGAGLTQPTSSKISSSSALWKKASMSRTPTRNTGRNLRRGSGRPK